MDSDDKLPWHQKVAIYIIVAGLFALILLIGIGLVALLPNHPGLASYLTLAITIVGLLFITNLPLTIRKNKDL